MKEVIAVLCADIHLSHKSPVARSAEPDWYAAMQRPLDELQLAAEMYKAPIVCAGDVFDRWNSNPELINWAILHLPRMYAVPGQHDLPNHRYDEIKKSAYWTLVEAGMITTIDPGGSRMYDGLAMHGFPWGVEVIPLENGHPDPFHLAVVHSYIWKQGCGYPGADGKLRVSGYAFALKRYDAAAFGDNHQGFIAGKVPLQPNLMNCGTLMRRKIDEVGYKPQIGLLHSDGSIIPHYLDTSKDLFLDEPLARAKEEQEMDVSRFLKELRALGADSLDFRDAVNRYMDSKQIDREVREMVLAAIDE